MQEKARLLRTTLLLELAFLAPDVLAAVLAHSLTVWADLLRCTTETVAVFLAWLTVRKLIHPSGEYEYGLGKLENVSTVGIAGLFVLAAGWVVFEAVGDYQLRRFKADPANERVIMDRGLWAWTRHPNYFGDACVWWGMWLASIAGWISLVTVLSPVLMTYFLVYATGARLTEKYMKNRPGFREYCSRTPSFVPRPPRLRIS